MAKHYTHSVNLDDFVTLKFSCDVDGELNDDRNRLTVKLTNMSIEAVDGTKAGTGFGFINVGGIAFGHTDGWKVNYDAPNEAYPEDWDTVLAQVQNAFTPSWWDGSNGFVAAYVYRGDNPSPVSGSWKAGSSREFTFTISSDDLDSDGNLKNYVAAYTWTRSYQWQESPKYVSIQTAKLFDVQDLIEEWVPWMIKKDGKWMSCNRDYPKAHLWIKKNGEWIGVYNSAVKTHGWVKKNGKWTKSPKIGEGA